VWSKVVGVLGIGVNSVNKENRDNYYESLEEKLVFIRKFSDEIRGVNQEIIKVRSKHAEEIKE